MPTGGCALVDSHCHPHFPQYGGDIAPVRAAMREHRVRCALAIATTRAEFAVVQQLAADYPGEFYAACGVHPNNDEEIGAEELVAACGSAAVLAVGETGLDYYRQPEEGGGIAADAQRQRFATHIEAARRLGKPLIIHTRESLDDTLEVLAAHSAGDIGGVLHCYTGDVAGARRILDLGFHVSFTGIVTFKNADTVRAAAAFVPADRYMVETDAPYLAPAPHRGKLNTPGYVRYVAQAMAAVRGCSEAQIVEESTATFNRLFKPPAAV